MRELLLKLGNTKHLSLVDEELRVLKDKIPPEELESLEEKGFPWWGWVLIGCSALLAIGAVGWLSVARRKRASPD